MSFAYYQGQEDQALDYYKNLMASTPDEQTRQEIRAFIEKLEKIVQERNQENGKPHTTVQNMSAA
jgi:hypothetical protein